MSKLYIYPYKTDSASVQILREKLSAKLIKLQDSKFVGGEGKIVLNWGNSTENGQLENSLVINRPEAVKMATDKRTFFETVQGQVSIPEFTVDKDVAESWLRVGKIVLAREKLNGHSGAGIVLINNLQDWSNYDHSRAKLYVMYVPKRDEYRVHVMSGEVIDLQRKAKNPDWHRDNVNFQIRNHSNGFIFVRNGTEDRCPEQVKEQAIQAIRLTGLDFGAVDVIWNEHRNTAYVLEINTAPGLEGHTVESYIEAIDRLYLNKPLEKPKADLIYMDEADPEEMAARERIMNDVTLSTRRVPFSPLRQVRVQDTQEWRIDATHWRSVGRPMHSLDEVTSNVGSGDVTGSPS